MPAANEEAGWIVYAGNRKMSFVRRTFCLFVTFDLGLTFILWVLYSQLIGQLGFAAFKSQVENYSFKTSLFDAVMLSVARFTLLLLFYALLMVRHWWPVALTTLITSAFLLTKVFLFDFSGVNVAGTNPLSYCMLIISFVLAWSETWFMDFKVLPWEKKSSLKLSNAIPSGGRGYSSLVDVVHQRLFSPHDSRSTHNHYYSPMESSEGSDDEHDGGDRVGGDVPSHQHQTVQAAGYTQQAIEAWETLWKYLQLDDSQWRLECGKSAETGLVFSQLGVSKSKVFKLQGELSVNAETIWQEMVHNIQRTPSWNPSMMECQIVSVLNDAMDITYNVAAGVGGLVSSRDFVNVRRWGCKDGVFLSAGVGVKHPSLPPTKKHVRGENGPGGWAFMPLHNDKCLFIWIMNVDIKGWFPRKVMDQSYTTVLLDYFKHLRKHAKDLADPLVT